LTVHAPKSKTQKRIELVLAILGGLGLSGVGLWNCAEKVGQRALVFGLSGVLQAQSRVDSIRTARMIQDTVRATVAPLIEHIDGRFSHIETYLIRIPDVRRFVTQNEQSRIRAERDSLERLRAFGPPGTLPTFHAY
jgi:hypothetical protein